MDDVTLTSRCEVSADVAGTAVTRATVASLDGVELSTRLSLDISRWPLSGDSTAKRDDDVDHVLAVVMEVAGVERAVSKLASTVLLLWVRDNSVRSSVSRPGVKLGAGSGAVTCGGAA